MNGEIRPPRLEQSAEQEEKHSDIGMPDVVQAEDNSACGGNHGKICKDDCVIIKTNHGSTSLFLLCCINRMNIYPNITIKSVTMLQI